MPDGLGADNKCLSGSSMDDITVHYHSDRPAALAASAYAQGRDIEIAPGQEGHLAHDPRHVVQQLPDRIRPRLESENERKPQNLSGTFPDKQNLKK